MFPELSLVGIASAFMYTKNRSFAKLLAGGILTIFVGVMMKKMSRKLNESGMLPTSLVFRPQGAFGCNGDQKIDCTNDIGLPSVHSMLAGFYVSAIGTQNINQTWPLILVPFSRLSKSDSPLFHHSTAGCHTYPQIFLGFALGMVIGKFIR